MAPEEIDRFLEDNKKEARRITLALPLLDQ